MENSKITVLLTEKEFSLWSRFKDSLRDKSEALKDTIIKKQGSVLSRIPVLKEEDVPGFTERESRGIRILDRAEYSPDSGGPMTCRPDKELYSYYKELVESGKYSGDDLKFLTTLMNINQKGSRPHILWNRDDGIVLLAHELGHARNIEGSIKDKLISKGHRFGMTLRRAKSGVLAAVLDIIGSNLIILEEKNATKKAIKMLKKYNLPRKDMESAESLLMDAINIYKLQRDERWRRKFLQGK